MSNDEVSESSSSVVQFRRVVQALDQGQPPLKSSGPGGTSGDMEGRIARLESDMEHAKKSLDRLDGRVEAIRSDVGAIKVDLATLKTNVSHLPTKAHTFATATGLLGAIGVVVALIVRFLPAAG